jgi:hypothetical protein
MAQLAAEAFPRAYEHTSTFQENPNSKLITQPVQLMKDDQSAVFFGFNGLTDNLLDRAMQETNELMNQLATEHSAQPEISEKIILFHPYRCHIF